MIFGLDRFFKKKVPEKWALVATFDTIVNDADTGKVHTVWFHLSESNFGNRSCKITTANTRWVDSYLTKHFEKHMKCSDMYQTKIYRWLQGRLDPAIPRYSEIPAEEVIIALRGKV